MLHTFLPTSLCNGPDSKRPVNSFLVLLVLAALGSMTGCGDGVKTVTTAKVEGTVTYLGKPVSSAIVTFMPATGRLAHGETNVQGVFTLMTNRPGDGAMPGEFKVTIAKNIPDTANSKPESGTPAMLNALPARYADPNQSGLTAKVKAGEKNEFKFDLTE